MRARLTNGSVARLANSSGKEQPILLSEKDLITLTNGGTITNLNVELLKKDDIIIWRTQNTDDWRVLLHMDDLKGYSPIKGVDYFDGEKGEKGEDGKDAAVLVKGIDYFDGKDGKDGLDGKDGESAYDLWKKQKGNEKKNIDEFFSGLKGERGDRWMVGGGAAIGIPAGGTQGQILSKNSATDYDTKWINASGGGTVVSVTGLNTDNTDPTNPVVQISVDGVTITGNGTPGSPLVGAAGSGTIGGSIASTQVAVGSGVNTISGSSGLTYSAGVLGVPGRIDMGYTQMTEYASITTPSAGQGAYYAKDDGTPHYVNPAGTDYNLANSGTVTSVTSANSDATVANQTTTPVITIVSAPKLTNARTIGGVSFDGTGNITVASATGGFAVSGGDLALGTNNITVTGSIGATGARVTKGWFTDLEATNAIVGSITGNAATVTNATLTTALTINGGTLTLTANAANNSVLTIGAGASSVSGSNTGDQTTISGNAGTATALQTARDIYGNSFDGTADLTQIIASTYGGTGNGFTKFSGPTTTEKTFTLPNATATILTDNATVTVAQGGTGITSFGSGVATWLGTPSSANLAAAVTDETGTGALVFATNPVIAKPQVDAYFGGIATYTPAAAATATLDCALNNKHFITMPAGNITIALSNISTGQCITVSTTQDGGGSRTVTRFSTIRWAGGVTPTLTTTANKRDTFGFMCTGSGTYDGFIIGQNI